MYTADPWGEYGLEVFFKAFLILNLHEIQDIEAGEWSPVSCVRDNRRRWSEREASICARRPLYLVCGIVVNIFAFIHYYFIHIDVGKYGIGMETEKVVFDFTTAVCRAAPLQRWLERTPFE